MATHKNAITTWGEIQVITSPQPYNIAGNYTPVKYTFQLVRTATSFGGYWSNNASTAKLSINGTPITVPNFTYDFRTNYTKVLATGTINITHDPDGQKTFAITASTIADASLPNGSLSASETLTRIPRTSTFTIPTSFNIGSTFTVSIARASSSFTHWVILYDGSTSLYSSGNTVGTSVSPNIAADTLVARISGVKSKVFTVQVDTYSGSTLIGRQTKSITASIPASTFTIPSSFNVGSAFTTSISRVSSSLTHGIELVDGSTVIYWNGKTTSTSLSSNVPADTLLGKMSGVKSKSFTVRLHTYNDDVWIAMTSKTITANIPISTFTAPSSFTMGSAFTVSISRVGSLTHWVELYDGSTWLYGSGNNVETSGSVNVALSTLAARSPNAMSKVFRVVVYTYNGDNQLGSQTKNITAYVPTSVKPTFSAVSVSENVSSVASLVGAYVQTKSRLNLAITGAGGIYGSTIKSYNITGVGRNVNSSSTVTDYLSVSGNQTIKGKVTDSRGQTFEKSIVVNILPYTPPTLSGLSFRRTLANKTEAPLGDNATVRASVKVHSLIVNGVQKNSIKYQVQSAQSGGSFATKADTTSTDLTKSYSDVWVGYSVDHSYNFRVRAGDVFGFGGWSVGVVPTGVVTQQWGSKTTSFGKMIDNTSYNVQVGTGGIQSDGRVDISAATNNPIDNSLIAMRRQDDTLAALFAYNDDDNTISFHRYSRAGVWLGRVKINENGTLDADRVVELIRTDSEIIRKWDSGVLDIDGTYQGTPNTSGMLSIPVGVTIVNPSAIKLPVISPHYNATPDVTLVVSTPTSTELRCYLRNTETNTPITTSQRVSYSYVGRWK